MVISLFMSWPVHMYANNPGYDSLLPEKNYSDLHAGTLLDLLDAENNFVRAGNVKKTLLKLLRIAGTKNSLRNNTLGAQLFLDLANMSTRLKLYPLAMKCYNQAIRINRKKSIPLFFESLLHSRHKQFCRAYSDRYTCDFNNISNCSTGIQTGPRAGHYAFI